jgi:hypothetical protein
MVQHERGEGVPGMTLADGHAREVDQDKQQRSPDGRPEQPALRDRVVRHNGQQQGEGHDVLCGRVLDEELCGPTANGSVDDGDVGDED